ncbi:MAG: hypothetical protein N2117_05025 [Anaerolineales bacterium]|nr:hypothetical protein [Anaerolineales bacterium]MCX7754592.1 hypothetical protein [Anaerolineales bacterium]MDW8277169.1 hypothetical protein [Anaerolineales bacterium]
MFRARHSRQKRPIAVTLIAWAIFVLFLARLVQAILPLQQVGIFQSGVNGALFDWGEMQLTPLGSALLTSTVYALLSLSGLVVLAGFLRMKRWSWVVLMVWTAISLTVSLLGYFYGRPNYIIMASDTFIALALNQADVQRIFKIRTDPGERLD